MIEPWTIVGWIVLAVLALAYVGGVLQLWSMWTVSGESLRRKVVGVALGLVWPFGIGAAIVKWIEEQA